MHYPQHEAQTVHAEVAQYMFMNWGMLFSVTKLSRGVSNLILLINFHQFSKIRCLEQNEYKQFPFVSLYVKLLERLTQGERKMSKKNAFKKKRMY